MRTEIKTQQMELPWVYNDGGQRESGITGITGGCVCRAITIATRRPYLEIYNLLREQDKYERRKSDPRAGVWPVCTERVMQTLGWEQTKCVRLGMDRGVRLRQNGGLPMGRLIVSLRTHATAVIDGVLYDTYNCSLNGTGIVYDYWQMRQK